MDFRNRKPDFEQLFNLDDDPGERNNLIGEMANSEVLRELREKTGASSDKLRACLNFHDRAKASKFSTEEGKKRRHTKRYAEAF